jgi:hypothetical protein
MIVARWKCQSICGACRVVEGRLIASGALHLGLRQRLRLERVVICGKSQRRMELGTAMSRKLLVQRRSNERMPKCIRIASLFQNMNLQRLIQRIEKRRVRYRS